MKATTAHPGYVDPALVATGVMGLVRQTRTCGVRGCVSHHSVRALVAGMFGPEALVDLGLVGAGDSGQQLFDGGLNGLHLGTEGGDEGAQFSPSQQRLG